MPDTGLGHESSEGLSEGEVEYRTNVLKEFTGVYCRIQQLIDRVEALEEERSNGKRSSRVCPDRTSN